MPACIACGKEIATGVPFCTHCGAAQTAATAAQSQPTDAEFTAYVVKNGERYLPKFRKFNVGGIDSFSATWHWPAFFAGFWWMLYRKMYLWAAIAFVVAFIPWIGFLAIFAWGVTGNFLYYKQAKKKILEVKAARPAGDLASVLAQVGGVHKWVWVVAVVLSVIVIVGIIAAIIIPQIAAVRPQ